MSNPAFTNIVIKGKRSEQRSLYEKMKRLQERKKPLVENGFYYPTRWLGNLVTRLGADWREVYCGGTWSDLRLNSNTLTFFTETAWKPPFELLKLISRVYPSLTCYFEAEGDDWDVYVTNDAEGRYFSARYVVDMEPDTEYFDTIEEVCLHVAPYIGRTATNKKELLHAIDEWEAENEDPEKYVLIKEIEVISESDYW